MQGESLERVARELRGEAKRDEPMAAHTALRIGGPADLYAEMIAGTTNLVIVDARYPETFVVEHLPGAISLPWRDIDDTTTAHLSRAALYVVYCWNANCHASTKTAQRLEALGFKVKELPGGLQDWKKQGYPTERA